ncbi:hypothetical protein CEP53_012893 [Fusarium sp. AF-6]|nr:hypothetical protein CEP53_012893 [Fusarium sp. AF-6]
MESNQATGNQSNDYSTQLNGPVSQDVRVYVGNSRTTPPQNQPPALSSVSETFCLGSISVFEEDQGGRHDSRPMPRPSPIIDKEDVEDISDIGIEIRQKYKLMLNHTNGVRVSCVKQLRQRVKVQRGRIRVQVEVIEKWPRFPAKPQDDDTSLIASQAVRPDSGMSHKVHCLRTKFREIHDKLKDAIDELSRTPKQSQSRARESRIKNSKVFKNLSDLVDQIELDIGTVQSQLYQLSGCHSSFEPTKGFVTLFVSSSATRTLYRHLCQACPMNVQEQRHSHTALVGLVPEREPRDIVPNEVALTTHHVAIESSFRKGDYIWFDAHSMLILPGDTGEAVYSEPSSPQAVIEGLQQRFRRDSGYSSTSAYSAREQLQVPQERPESSESYCIKVCPGSLAQGSDGLAMCIGDDQERGCHEMLYLDEKSRPKTSCEPLKLSHIIQQGDEEVYQHHPDLFKRSHKLKDDRFKMAFKIAEAALRYGWREWLGDAWGIRNIEFYPYKSERKPFLRAKILKHGGGKLEKFMFNLGFVLLQLGLWKQIEVHTPGRIFDRVLEHHLSCLGTSTSDEFQEAVRYCVEFGKCGDYDGDDNDFQQTFYQKVISPLREMAKRVENIES